MKQSTSQYISVGIPTYNSSKYLSSCLNSLINLKMINEVIVSDDCSSNAEQYKIEKIISDYSNKLPIKFLKNKENFGAYTNKFKLIENSLNEFIYVLDSDNLAAKNLDKIIKNYVFKEKRKDIIFQPNIMYQFWKYPYLGMIFSNFFEKYKVKFFNEDTILDFEKVYQSLIINSGSYDLSVLQTNLKLNQNRHHDKKDIMLTKWIFWVLNCGNFIVNKESMVKVADKGFELDRSLRSVDAIVFTYLWLSKGNSIKVPKDFYHHHRKREDSVSFTAQEDSKKAIEYFIKKIIE